MTTNTVITNTSTSVAADKLLTPQTGKLAVAPQPAGGQGLALDPRGQIPLAVRKLLPGYEMVYAQVTSPVTMLAATATIVTAAATQFPGTAMVMHGHIPEITAAAGDTVNIILVDNGSQLAVVAQAINNTAAAIGFPLGAFSFALTPSKGKHTYSLIGSSTSGSGVAEAGPGTGGGLVPAYIQIVVR